MKTRSRRCQIPCVSVLNDVENLGPEGFDSSHGLGRDRQNAVDAVGFLECGEGLGELVAAQAIGLGADHQVRALHGVEGIDEQGIALLRGNVGVDQANAEGELFALGEVRFDELGPLGGDGLGDLGVSIAGQIREDERRTGVELGFGAVMEREEVDGPGAAGRGGDFRFFRAEQGIDQRRFADVGAAEEGDFGGVKGARRVGELVGAHGGEQKFWNEAHGLSLSLAEPVCAETHRKP